MLRGVLSPVLRGVLDGSIPRHASGAAFVGPLDGVTSTLAVSTRRLYANYSGSLIRLRRDSDNAESDFGYDSDGDLDTAAIATWLGAATGHLAVWYDQSGNGNDLSQAVAAEQFRYENNIFGAVPGLRSLNVSLMTIANVGVVHVQPYSWHTVLKTPASIARYRVCGNVAESPRLEIDSDGGGAFVATAYAGAFPGVQELGFATTEETLQISALINGASSSIRKNGVEVATGNAGTDDGDGVRLSQRNALAYDGHYGEHVEIPDVTARAAFEADQVAYFGIP